MILGHITLLTLEKKGKKEYSLTSNNTVSEVVINILKNHGNALCNADYT